jgi:hypothetical protein
MQVRRGKFKKDLNFDFSHSEDEGFDMHFCPTEAKMQVATSVCTGGSDCPPDSRTAIGSNPYPYKIKNPTTKVVGFLMAEDEGFEFGFVNILRVSSCVLSPLFSFFGTFHYQKSIYFSLVSFW